MIRLSISPQHKNQGILPKSKYNISIIPELSSGDAIYLDIGNMLVECVRVLHQVQFEQNDHETRDRVTKEVMEVMCKNKISGSVRCLHSNNGPDVTDNNMLVVDLFNLKENER